MASDEAHEVKSIPLAELLHRLYGVAGGDIPDGLQVVEQVRGREARLRRFLPSTVVRRLDAGFARSRTVHPDTGRSLYAICRASGATNVFETGTYWGYSTAYLAAALRDAGTGTVWSFDIYSRAGKHIPRELRAVVQLRLGRPSTEAMPEVLRQVSPEVFFQDSRHDYEGVRDELLVVKPHLKPRAVVLFHDFVQPDVRRAAAEVLDEYTLRVIAGDDPQQLGIAFRADTFKF